MRTMVCAALTWVAMTAVAQPGALVIGRRDHGARVSLDYIDGSDRGVGYFQTVRVTADQRLSRRGSHVELVVKGHLASRGAFLSPSGPASPRHHDEDFEHVWTGDAQTRGSTLFLHFTHTTSTRPAQACEETFRCDPDETVRDALRCVSTRTFAHHGSDGHIPAYFRVPLLLARGRALVVDASGSD
jgi:hypothetical protein